MKEIAENVFHLPLSIENVYFVGQPGNAWFLVDAGTPGSAGRIQKAAAELYGADSKPSALFLTHGHTDHVGSAPALLEAWTAPIYAHPLELPYITGKSPYPPKDPTVGGAMAMLSRVFPMNIVNLGSRIQPLPPEGALPGVSDWEWFFTPGHAPGHVSFFRSSDRTLLGGDAFATVNLASFFDIVTKKPEISLPPTPFTCDWSLARRSVELLAGLDPVTIGCGHGTPLTGANISPGLRHFSKTFTPPAHGRYIPDPARTDENGIVSVPPPAPDPFPAQLAAGVGVAAIVIALARRGRKS